MAVAPNKRAHAALNLSAPSQPTQQYANIDQPALVNHGQQTPTSLQQFFQQWQHKDLAEENHRIDQLQREQEVSFFQKPQYMLLSTAEARRDSAQQLLQWQEEQRMQRLRIYAQSQPQRFQDMLQEQRRTQLDRAAQKNSQAKSASHELFAVRHSSAGPVQGYPHPSPFGKEKSSAEGSANAATRMLGSSHTTSDPTPGNLSEYSGPSPSGQNSAPAFGPSRKDITDRMKTLSTAQLDEAGGWGMSSYEYAGRLVRDDLQIPGGMNSIYQQYFGLLS